MKTSHLALVLLVGGSALLPASCGGWLLLSENWYPGWVAYDETGASRPARRGDLCFLAVPAAAAGRLEYRPRWLVPAVCAC